MGPWSRHSRRATLLPVLVAAAFAGSAASASTFTTLYSFVPASGGSTDANNPHDGLVRDSAGNLYGTAFAGGAGSAGAVYELSPPAAGQTAWTETVLHSFSFPRGTTDGAEPQGRLTLGAGGVLYGTTAAGGGADDESGGTVFSLTPPAKAGGTWRERVLTVFPAPHGLTAQAFGSLAQDGAGVLYGVTMEGGAGAGILFMLTPPAAGETAWKRTTIHSFAPTGAAGEQPSTGLIIDASGALYGSTIATSAASGRAGVVYRLTPPAAGQTAWTYTTIYGFPTDGAHGSTIGQLELDASGALYGVAAAGGAAGAGVVFRLTPPADGQAPWTWSLVRGFAAGAGTPEGGVVPNGAGSLLGTTAAPTKTTGGSIYLLVSPSNPQHVWTLQTLAKFITKPVGGGSFPVGALVPDGSGNFFGVTESGGAGGVGTIFDITP